MSADIPDRHIKRRAREGVLEQKPVGGKSQKPRLWKLEVWHESGPLRLFESTWRKLGNYASEKVAREVAIRRQRGQYRRDYGAPPSPMRFRLNGAEFIIGG